MHGHLKKEKEKAGSEGDGWIAASSSSSARAANPTQPEIADEGTKKRRNKATRTSFRNGFKPGSRRARMRGLT